MISLFVLYLVVGIVLTLVFELILKHNKALRDRYYRRHEVLFGLHVHHSAIGLLLCIVSIFVFLFHGYTAALIILALGLGVIIMHTASAGRVVFIEKNNFKKTKHEERSRI